MKIVEEAVREEGGSNAQGEDEPDVQGTAPRRIPPPLDIHGRFQEVVLATFRAHGFVCITALGEADHQLAHMCRQGEIDGVITVDSALLVLCCPPAIHQCHAWWDGLGDPVARHVAASR
mmetsp:Transcript_18196/g.53026  ORF Transcript_18196/g.53026 Transcript_18196/m.53026 type:complete len:119 (-) Transcript_18196:865-1221(-)